MDEPTRVNTVWSVGRRACVDEPTRVNTVWSADLRATLQATFYADDIVVRGLL